MRAPKAIVSQDPSDVHTVVVHHTAGKAKYLPAAVKRELRNIQAQHMDANGWSDIGYNFLSDSRGVVWEGRGLRRVGAHTLGHNTGTIGISFLGNYEIKKLNKKQIKAYNDLLKRLKLRGCAYERVNGHNQMPNQATACPGINITRQLGL